ncbi:unnamed protein product [Brassicogethes aeneus]|uniref:Transmembrane protein 177 n=1 Tax=Brassicogethes aeneus TaxID=1431903 RepID=A0A9P0ANJ9_BRAAE|nr:unnamed protein product [Brassicogethes aeneus]
MSSRKIFNWFITENGRKFSFYAAGAASTCAMLLNFLPQTILLEQYKDLVQLYKKGLSVPVSLKLKERFLKAIEITQVHPLDRELFKPFSAYGFEIFSAGSIFSRYGVIVGLPANFSYDSLDGIDKSIIKVNNEPVPWDTEEGQALLNSLVLSENAQLYAIAREIRYRQTSKPLLDVFLATSSCLVAYGLGNKINKKFNFYMQPFPLRFIMYSLVGLFVAGNYIICKDFSQIYYEESIDKELKEIPEMASGGKEFYEKILQRNVALRKLMGKDGENLYTSSGNENYMVRLKHIPLVQRKSFFEKNIPA